MVPAMRVSLYSNPDTIHMDEHGNNMQEVSICDSSMNSSLFVKKAKLSVLQALQVYARMYVGM